MTKKKSKHLLFKVNTFHLPSVYLCLYYHLYCPVITIYIATETALHKVSHYCFTPKCVQFHSIAQSCWTLWDPMDCSRPGFPIQHHSLSLIKLMSIKSVMPSNHLILCHPLLLLPSVFPSIWVFSNESVLPIRWPKSRSFRFSISPSNAYSGLISFRIDRLDLLAVQGTLKSLLQHHSSKASILQRSAFFMVQLSHPYMTTGKIIALTRWAFVGKVMSLLSNMLFRFVIAFVLKV